MKKKKKNSRYLSRSGTSRSSTVVVRAWACSTWCLGTGRTYVPLMPKEATRSYRHACNVKLLHRALKCRDYKKKKKAAGFVNLGSFVERISHECLRVVSLLHGCRFARTYKCKNSRGFLFWNDLLHATFSPTFFSYFFSLFTSPPVSFGTLLFAHLK